MILKHRTDDSKTLKTLKVFISLGSQLPELV